MLVDLVLLEGLGVPVIHFVTNAASRDLVVQKEEVSVFRTTQIKVLHAILSVIVSLKS